MSARMGAMTMIVDERPIYEIDPEVQDELVKHPGMWAVMTRTAVIAIRDTPGDAYAAARAAGIDDPILYQIPDTRAGYSYF